VSISAFVNSEVKFHGRAPEQFFWDPAASSRCSHSAGAFECPLSSRGRFASEGSLFLAIRSGGANTKRGPSLRSG